MANKLSLFIHLVWNTWDRQPSIIPRFEQDIHRIIVSQAQNLNCHVIAINGTSDHIHLVLEIPSTISVARLVKQLKAVSSKTINDQISSLVSFKWQRGYGAFSVSRWDVPKIVHYVQNQKQHHQSDHLNTGWEYDYFNQTQDG